MDLTLIKTKETLDIKRETPDGSLECVGSYEVAISDPGFVSKAEALVTEIDQKGLTSAAYDYGDLAGKATELLRAAFTNDSAVSEILGDAPDMFNALYLLVAVMKIVNKLDPGKQLVDKLNELLPDDSQLSAEMIASQSRK